MKRQAKIKRRPQYRICPYCQAHIDAQEVCSCREEIEEASRVGQALQLKMEDWGQYRYAAQ